MEQAQSKGRAFQKKEAKRKKQTCNMKKRKTIEMFKKTKKKKTNIFQIT